jgi:hypothetical protein
MPKQKKAEEEKRVSQEKKRAPSQQVVTGWNDEVNLTTKLRFYFKNHVTSHHPKICHSL